MPLPGMIIPIQETGLLKVMLGLDALSQKMRSMPQQVKIHVGMTGTGPGGTGGGGASAAVLNNAINQTQKLTNAYKAQIGPAQALMKAQLNLRNALLFGNGAQQFDAQYLVNQAQGRMNRAQRGPTHPVMQAIMTSRFGMGGGVQPLVGRSLAALSSLGPAGMAAAAAVVAVGALGMAANHAAGLIRNLAGARFTSGGTPGQIGMMAGLAAGTGQSVGGIAGQSRELALRLASDPYARMAGQQYGVKPDYLANNPMHAKLNTAENYLKLAQGILNDANESRAVRAARATGMENILGMRDMSPGLRNRLLNMNAEMMTPQGRQAAADLQGTLGLLSLSMQKLLMSATPLIEGFAGGALLLSNIIDYLIKVAKTVLNIPGLLYQGIRSLLGLDNTYDLINQKIKNIWDPAKAQDEQTRAIKDNTKELRQFRNGLWGGGERAKGAMPGRAAAYWQQSLPPEAMQLGAFSL